MEFELELLELELNEDVRAQRGRCLSQVVLVCQQQSKSLCSSLLQDFHCDSFIDPPNSW